MVILTSSTGSMATGPLHQRRHRLNGALLALLLILLVSLGVTAQGTDGPVKAKVPGVTIVRMATGSDIESTFVVVDGRQMKNVNLGQLADYIALVGLADLRLDADSTAGPSILDLFGHGTPPQGLTRWDRAFLYSLYNTTHRSTLEVPEMEIMMTRRVAR